MTVRNQSIDRLARWTAAGVATAGLSLAIIPLAHGGLRRSSTPKQPVVIAPAAQQPAQPAAAPVYIPQPLYYPAGAPLPQVPPQYNAVQEQVTGQQDSAVSRELRRLYEESGRQAPPLPGTQQPQPQPAPVAPPAFQLPPGYVAVPAPGYAAAPGYAPAAVPQGYAPQQAYYPQPGYVPAQVAAPVPAPGYAPQQHQAPPSQQLSTEPAEDPEFFPAEGLANKQLNGLEFEEGPRRTQPHPQQAAIPQPIAPQYQQPFAVIPLQQPVQQPTVQPQRPSGHGFAYPGPASQQQPTPIITAGVVPPNVTPPPSAVKLPKAEDLIVGSPIETDYEMTADPKAPKKGFFKRFGSSSSAGTKPPEEPNHYIPNPAAQLSQNDDIPLAPSADVPGPEADPAMAEIAKFSMPEPGIAPVTEAPPATSVVEELPPPEVTPKTRTLPVAAATTIGSAAKKGVASELFKDELPAPAPEIKTEKPAVKPAAPKKSGGIAAGGLGPGKNVVPEQPEPAAEGPVASAVQASPSTTEMADSAAPSPKAASSSPYTGLSLDGPGEAQAPLVARQNRGMFFPPVSAEPQTEPTTEPAPLPVAPSTEFAPPTMTTTVQPVSQAPAGKTAERSQYTQSKYEQIASRKGATGLKGFCPVRLRDHRDLADGQAEFRVQHNGRVYALSSAEALKTFLSNPEKYVPAANGYDVVVHQQSGDTVEGILDHSAWFKGKLYLFASAENKDAFVTNPAAYAVK